MSDLALITPVDDRVALLPYHVEYYSKLGIRQFVYVVWDLAKNPVTRELKSSWEAVAPRDATLHLKPSTSCSYDAYNEPAEVPYLNQARQDLLKDNPDFWYCIADLDEFYYFGGQTIPDFIHHLKQGQSKAAGAVFHDRVASDGSFPELPPHSPGKYQLDALFPMVADLTKSCGATVTKIAVAAGHVEIRSGHHSARFTKPSELVTGLVECHHFKWHAGVTAFLPRRYSAYQSQALSWAKEATWYQELFKRPQWQHDPQLRLRQATRLGI